MDISDGLVGDLLQLALVSRLAAPKPRFAEIAAVGAQLGLQVTVIGELGTGAGVTWSLNGENYLPSVQGYHHFR